MCSKFSKSGKTNWIIPAGLYFLLSCIFFFPLFQGKALIYSDNLLQRAPAYFFLKQELLQGRFPLWSPEIFAGMPFLADPSHSVLSPFNLVFFLFNDIFQAVTFQVIIFVFLSSLGAFFLARSLKIGTLPSFLVGVVYGLSGSVIDTANDVNSLAAISLIPWVLKVFTDEVYIKRRYFSWKLALIITLQILSGHTQYVYYTILVFSAVFGWLVIKDGFSFKEDLFKKIGAFFLTILLAMAIAAIQLIPTWELVNETKRAGSLVVDEVSLMKWLSLPRLIFPKIYGSFVEGNSWGPQSQHERGLADVSGYVNLAALALAFMGVLSFWRKKLIGFLAVIAGTFFI